MTNLQLNGLKSGIKNCAEATLNLLSNVIGNYNDEYNFPHKLLLTNRQLPRPFKAYLNNSSVNIKLSKTRLHKIRQSGGFVGRLLGPLLKAGLFLLEHVLKPLAKSILIRWGLTASASATDAAIQ